MASFSHQVSYSVLLKGRYAKYGLREDSAVAEPAVVEKVIRALVTNIVCTD